MSKIQLNPKSIYLSAKCYIGESTTKVGEIQSGLDLRNYNLIGKTVVKTRPIFTDNLSACTAGLVVGNKLNMFHENSSIYNSLNDYRPKIFKEMTNKMLSLAEKTTEKVQAFLFGGWGYGSNLNKDEVEKSHNLFNNIAFFIEDILPKTEGLEVPLTTIWGKLDSKNCDAVYASKSKIVLINDVFKELFKNGDCKLNREKLIDFLKQHYEEVQIPEHVNIIAEENYISCKNISNKQKLNTTV